MTKVGVTTIFGLLKKSVSCGGELIEFQGDKV